MSPTRTEPEMFSIGVIHDERGWTAVLRGPLPQKTYGPEIDVPGLLSLIAEDLEQRDTEQFIRGLEAARKVASS